MKDYYDKIKRPMDFTTIENRLNHKYYVCGAECIADIDQVFTNCFLYNPPEYPYYFLGKLLSKAYDDAMIDLPTDEHAIPLKGILKRSPHWPGPQNVAAEEMVQPDVNDRRDSASHEPEIGEVVLVEAEANRRSKTQSPEASSSVNRRKRQHPKKSLNPTIQTSDPSSV
uniref:Bromo domain-containing protein n=1 Tax=Panagrellus redivivus TaxID=6233 RepID=A0A7E4WD23_PANRE